MNLVEFKFLFTDLSASPLLLETEYFYFALYCFADANLVGEWVEMGRIRGEGRSWFKGKSYFEVKCKSNLGVVKRNKVEVKSKYT